MKLNWKRAKSDIEKRSYDKNNDKPVVLLVDDEELNLRLMGQLLEKYFKVHTAKSGIDAMKLLNTPNLSVIISDQRMPQMTGVELFEQAVRQAHPASRILLTGYADAQNVVQAINAGHIYRYLEKPIPEDALVAAVRKAVSLYERNQQMRNDVTSLKKEIQRSARLRKGLNSSQIQPLVQPEDDLILSQPRYHEQELAVMVLDLRGFGNFSKTHGLQESGEVLQTLIRQFHEIISKYGGNVEQHLGDGLIASFGQLNPLLSDLAPQCALHLSETFPSLRSQVNAEELRLGIGLTRGNVLGMLNGSQLLQEWTLMGKTVDLAFRLTELTQVLARSERLGRDPMLQFKNAVVFAKEFDGLPPPFKLLTLPDDFVIRGFSNVRKIDYLLH